MLVASAFVSDFRPISLISSFLKIISTILATQLAKVIDQLADKSQSAFIKERYIVDNVVATQELIFSLHKRGIVGTIVKVDYIKTFDMVDWDLLMDLLIAKGFYTQWKRWIKSLLGTSKATILVNGMPSAYV